MRFSTRSQYGLRAMAYLANSPEKVLPLKVIAKTEELSFDYLEKIIAKLEKAGLVKAKRGAGGGYSLAKKPKDIKAGDIIKVLEGNMIPVRCLAKEKKLKYSCPRERKCQVQKVWKKIQDSINLTLNSITLADLMKK